MHIKKELSCQGITGVWVFQGPQLKYKTHQSHLSIYLIHFNIY
jgi:hypothetical protein